MALRSIVGKLRGPPAAVAASRAFSKTCEQCGKTSSRTADSLGQKNGAIKDDWRKELKWFKRKHYMIRTLAAAATFGALGISGKYTIDLLESDALIRSKK
ncbi:unnamed protein product [Urochloa decumbens]|uniref:Uncharacterized protein n=1 Tax=Urochloa decumbens TaxID=240449 RepID=A0ABC9GDM5_9POAL